MKALFRVAALVLSLFASAPLAAQTTTIGALPAGTAPLGPEVFPAWQGTATKGLTYQQLNAPYIGTSAPAVPFAYQRWLNTSSTPYILSEYDGAQWVQLGTLNASTHAWIPAGAGTAAPKNLGKSVNDPGSGALEALLPIQTKSQGSYTFAAADLQLETRRSNAGSAMSDFFPASTATGMANGARLTLNNFDTAGADTVTAGSGTNFTVGTTTSSTYVIEAGRSVVFVYDAANATWRPTMNTGAGAVLSASGSNVPGHLVTMASTYGKVQDSGVPLPAGRNLLINGSAAVDQRNQGASQTITSSLAYTVDRWYALQTGANITGQQEANPLTGFATGYKFTGATSNTTVKFGQRIESKNIAPLVNQNVAGEIELRSSSLTQITWTALYANATDNFSSETQIATGTCAISASFSNCLFSFNAGANAGNGIDIVFSGGALIGSQTLEWTGAQLEPGTTSTPVENLTYATQLANCLRYAWRLSPTGNFGMVFGGIAFTTNGNIYGEVQFPAPMRAAPSMTQSGTNLWLYDYAANVDSGNGSVSLVTDNLASAFLFANGTGVLAAGRPGYAGGAGVTSSALLFVSEL